MLTDDSSLLNIRRLELGASFPPGTSRMNLVIVIPSNSVVPLSREGRVQHMAARAASRAAATSSTTDDDVMTFMATTFACV